MFPIQKICNEFFSYKDFTDALIMESLPNEIVERILRSHEISFHDLVAFSSTCSRCISFLDAFKELIFTVLTGSK